MKKTMPIIARFIKRINPNAVLATLIWFTGLSVTNQLYQFRKELQAFRGSVVFDIDKVRSTMYDELSYMYVTGCRAGIEYPPEYRESSGFNLHSPVIYCDEERDKHDDYIKTVIREVGK